MDDCLATIDMGREVRGGGNDVSLSKEGVGSPSNTMLPGPRPTSISSGILIHPTVWPQYTNVTDRHTLTGQTGHRCHSIGQNVTCNSCPKIKKFMKWSLMSFCFD